MTVFTGTNGNDTITPGRITSGVTRDPAGGDFSRGDTLNGLDGDDILDGGPGDNVLNGGGGNDTITLSGSFERADGGSGDDLFTLRAGARDSSIYGGTGFDTVSYQNIGAGVTIDLDGTTIESGGAGTQSLVDVEGVIGTSFDDVLGGSGTGLVLDGGRGADRMTLNGTGGTIVVDGAGDVAELGQFASGTILVRPGATDYTINTFISFATLSYALISSSVSLDLGIGASQDTGGGGRISQANNVSVVIGSSAGDRLTGYAFNSNTLDGRGGDDVLTAVGVGQELLGGDGDDRLRVVGTPSNVTLNGGGGIDTGDYGAAGAGVTLSLAVTTPQASGGLGNQTLIDVENLIGSDFADNLTGNGLANRLEGRGGADVLDGGGGGDLLIVEIGADRADGGAADDTVRVAGALSGGVLQGGAGIDTLSFEPLTSRVAVSLGATGVQSSLAGGTFSQSGFENLTGGLSDDVLTGDAAANRIEGGNGDDRITGGGGADTMLGGAGRDTILLQDAGDVGQGGGDNDTFLVLGGGGTADGGDDSDGVDFSSAAAPVVVSLQSADAQDTGGAGTITLRNIEAVFGTTGGDEITGDAAANVLAGGGGQDVLFGEDGEDLLQGGAGNDRLAGGSGADWLLGEAGDDTFQLGVADLVAPAGATVRNVDMVNNAGGSPDARSVVGRGLALDLLDGGDGADLVLGTNDADIVVLSAPAQATYRNLQDPATRLVSVENFVLLGGDDVLSLTTTAPTKYTTTITASGGAGNDTLWAGAGDDELRGDADNDYLAGGRGDDFLTGGSGADLFGFAERFGNDVVLDFNPLEGDKLRIKGFGTGLDSYAELVAAGAIDRGTGQVVITLTDASTVTITLQGFDGPLAARDFQFVA